MATSEIEKLERRYAENPHGLTFAPLAEVHRKNGDVARALELLTAGLELHPNYIPASIVLGRCHQDLGDLSAAEAAFAHVLRLDDENVIALKSLADINERLERFTDAESWLHRLVSVDRSNDEAREQLRRLEALKNGDRAAVAPPPETAATELDTVDDRLEQPHSASGDRPSSEVVALDLPPIDLAALDLSETAPGAAPPELVSPASNPVDPAQQLGQPAAAPAEKKAPDISPETEMPEPVAAEPVAPMSGLVVSEFEPPKGPVGNPRETLGIDVETSEEVVLEGSGGSEYRVPDASEDFMSLAAKLAGMREPPLPEESEPLSPLPVDRAPASELEFLKETNAETPAKRSYVVQETKGQSVATFFRSMLAARPPSEPDSSAEPAPPPDAGTAPRPAQDGLSLTSVIGEEAPKPKADAAVSFDDFFSPKPGGAAPDQESPKPGKDDLDQFHSWLQNLKR